MLTDLVKGRTKEELEKNIEKQKAEGWKTFGEGGIIQLEYNHDNLPKFIYYWQGMYKESSIHNK